MKKLFSLLIITCISAIIYSNWIFISDEYYRIIFPPNKEYFSVLKTGKWEITEDTSKAEFFRLISYDNENNPIGLVQDFYKTGQLQWQGHISSLNPFIRKGECIRYFESGKMESRISYVNGIVDGQYEIFYTSGIIKQRGGKKGGKLHGIKENFHKNGKLARFGHYNEGLANGVFRNFRNDEITEPEELYFMDTLIFQGYESEKKKKKIGIKKLKLAGKYYLASETESNKGNYSESIKLLTLAINLNEDYALAYEKRGLANYHLGNFKRAIIDFKTSIKSNHPEPYSLNYSIACIETLRGNFHLAKKIYFEVTDICKNSETEKRIKGFSFKGIADIFNQEEDYNSSIIFYSKAINSYPSESQFYSDRAWNYLLLENDSLALLDCNLSIELSIDNDEAYTYRAIIKANSNDLYGALADVSFALEINPNNSQALKIHQNIYNVLYRQNYVQHYDSNNLDWTDIALGTVQILLINETIKDINKGNWGQVIFDVAVDIGLSKLLN